MFRKSITTLGLIATGWELIFVVLFLSSMLPRLIMDGALVCGVVSALACYFPLYLKDRFNWIGEREWIPVALSFVILFLGLGISSFVLMVGWIGSM